ncbi:hypothetical protein GCM10009733_103450 [Nonomuraea maheshkhaliensis]|uniref:Uncharacterized protein n=1 Tax=Nonomuraea maheshkhaliensis TaxID=419590 RepID=A0ABP4TP33_9ACTN
MTTAEVIALAAALLAAAVAVTVPVLAFRFTIRQEQVRWLREQRAQLYVDMLTEAYAEQQWLERNLLDGEDRQFYDKRFDDLRLSPFERARLGARANIIGSREVNRRFMALQQTAFWSGVTDRSEGARHMTRIRADEAVEKLQVAIRKDLGSDSIALDGTPHRADQPRSGTGPAS